MSGRSVVPPSITWQSHQVMYSFLMSQSWSLQLDDAITNILHSSKIMVIRQLLDVMTTRWCYNKYMTFPRIIVIRQLLDVRTTRFTPNWSMVIRQILGVMTRFTPNTIVVIRQPPDVMTSRFMLSRIMIIWQLRNVMTTKFTLSRIITTTSRWC